MGRRSSQKKGAVLLDTNDTGSKSSSSTIHSKHLVEPYPEDVQSYKDSFVDECVDALYGKRGTTREKALALLIKHFSNKVQYAYVQKKFLTILSLCLNSIKRGSANEITLAAHLIGLLALTTGPGSKAREILQESVGPISEALKSRTVTSKSMLLECLAIITFIGGEDTEKIENSLQLMWQVANPKLGTNVIAVKSAPPQILETAVSAWAFLFTAINASTLSPKSWHESISFLSSLLEKDDRSVRIAAGESLALVFETGNFKNLGDELRASSSDTSAERSGGDVVHKHGLLSKVVEQVRNLSAESGGKGTAKKDLSSQRNTFKDIQEFLEGGSSPATSMKIGGKSLSTETWAQLIQLNFIKHFLGGGFVNHMQKNEFLQDLFAFTQEKSLSGNQRTISNRKKEIFGHNHMSGCEKRLFKSPNSYLNKSRTQIRNKERTLSENINSGDYGVEEDNI